MHPPLSDIVVAEQFARVIGFLDPPTTLFHPALIARIASTNLRRRQNATAESAVTRSHTAVRLITD